jgi:hypothetical protein
MADGGHNIFVYLGGEQEVPADVTHVRIDRSVKIIPERAFSNRKKLVSVETHDGIEKVEQWAFRYCVAMRGIKLPGVKEIENAAFSLCTSLMEVDFGDKLESIGGFAFNSCLSLGCITLPTVKVIKCFAFVGCEQLTDMELPAVERIEESSFFRCNRLQRVVIPLKDNLFSLDSETNQRYTQFNECENLTTVDLVGGMHKTISSLLLESWKDEMNQEIDRINQDLPHAPVYFKTSAVQDWIRSVINRMKHYKAEHNRLLKEDMTQLELAVWKAKLDDFMTQSLESQPTKKAKFDVDATRKEKRITSGADIIIKNVLPFLRLV